MKPPWRRNCRHVTGRHDDLCHSGHAIDAAVTACSLQSVPETHNTGLGGDCFALVWKAREGRLYALTGAGAAPQALSDRWLLGQGMHGAPKRPA